MKELIWHRQLLPSVDRNAGRTFLTDTGSGTTTTYGEHGARVLRLASALRKELGVEPGDRVAVMSLNSGAVEEVYHAGLLGAAVVNPLNLRFAPRELAHVLSDSATKVVFVDAWFAGVIDSVREASGVRTVVLVGEGADSAPHDRARRGLPGAGAWSTAPSSASRTRPVPTCPWRRSARSASAAGSSRRSTGAGRRRRPRPSATAGTTPATPGAWTRRASSTSSTAPRT